MSADITATAGLPAAIVPTAIEAYTDMAVYYRQMYGESLLCGRPRDEYRQKFEDAEDNVIALRLGRPIKLLGDPTP